MAQALYTHSCGNHSPSHRLERESDLALFGSGTQEHAGTADLPDRPYRRTTAKASARIGKQHAGPAGLNIDTPLRGADVSLSLTAL